MGYNPVRSLRSANSGLLAVPVCHKSWGERAFAHAGPSLWNSLPLSLRKTSSKDLFKYELKTYFFFRSFNFFLMGLEHNSWIRRNINYIYYYYYYYYFLFFF